MFMNNNIHLTLLIIIIILIAILLFFNYMFSQYYIIQIKNKEGFENNKNKIIIRDNDDIYDSFYSAVYPTLFPCKNRLLHELHDIQVHAIGPYEKAVVNGSIPVDGIRILDIGCGHGNHVAKMRDMDYNIIGLDKSEYMINDGIRKNSLPSSIMICDTVYNRERFKKNEFSHIMSLYFTSYYWDDFKKAMSNIKHWLQDGGYFIIHLVDRNKFDPVLEPASPFPAFSIQKYAKPGSRITDSKVEFNNFSYNASFDLNEEDNMAYLTEVFDANAKKIPTKNYYREQIHTLYMPSHNEIVSNIKKMGFQFTHRTHLIHCEYEYQYLYYFKCNKNN
jgi:SAM-dependent methyltransferase